MKLFVINLFVLGLLCIGLIIGGLYMPSNPKVFKSLLFAQIDKDSLLMHTPATRLILVGGSNLSFGIDSKMLKDSLNVNPINTGIHANFGLKYMLDHVKRFIKPGDIIVVAPEYPQYYNSYCYGEEELLRVVFDVSKSDATNLSLKQWINITPFIGDYISSKFNLMDRLYPNSQDTSVYLRSSFNKYGDDTAHWARKREQVIPFGPLIGPFNADAIEELKKFETIAKQRGAIPLLTYAGFQESSFKASENQIEHIRTELLKAKFDILGSPERYRFADTLFYNTPYHLTKTGTIQRTKLLIQDLRRRLYPSN